MKMKFSHVFAAGCLVILVMLASQAQVSRAVTCTITELSPCLSAITGPNPPSQACCAKLMQQRPCLCGYIKDPNFGSYVNSPKAKGIAKTCNVPIPKC
ncbi:hypothetical protein ACH5RR_013858 [Cinchona calisaya]|uniref:Bifunctional inhibitor/plant lipid transfer protein/seed storage helical domain-containing protein n=1 Tax=Cinchona calisaya TaxID=153742 RepID=A0ABD3A179_9GENT